jgi:hypothetical protein
VIVTHDNIEQARTWITHLQRDAAERCFPIRIDIAGISLLLLDEDDVRDTLRALRAGVREIESTLAYILDRD